MNCPNCMQPIPSDSEFCQYCGTKISKAEISPQASPKPSVSPAAPPKKRYVHSRISQRIPSTGESEGSQPPHVNPAKLRKAFFKKKYIPIYAAVILLLSLGSYWGVNYSQGVSALNDEKFSEAKVFFDRLPLSNRLFQQQYAYMEAGILIEHEMYLSALQAFNELEDGTFPDSVRDNLISEMYQKAQSLYRQGDTVSAKVYFSDITPYKQSADYLTVISILHSSSKTAADYRTLLKMLHFENVKEIILDDSTFIYLFLSGRWEGGNSSSLYFLMEETSNGYHCSYSLPHNDLSGYYYLSNGIYSIGEKWYSATEQFRFSIVDEDTISVYCYKNGDTYILYRQ